MLNRRARSFKFSIGMSAISQWLAAIVPSLEHHRSRRLFRQQV